MSIRTIAGRAAVIATLLAAPASASAQPIDPVDTGAHVGTLPPAAEQPTIAPGDGTGGVGTLTVLAVAGSTLLAGAATGFAGGRRVALRA